MTTDYEIVLGRHVVSTRRAPNAREAAIDYLRALGCPPNELTYLAADAVSWHGAVYKARPAEPDPSLAPPDATSVPQRIK